MEYSSLHSNLVGPRITLSLTQQLCRILVCVNAPNSPNAHRVGALFISFYDNFFTFSFCIGRSLWMRACKVCEETIFCHCHGTKIEFFSTFMKTMMMLVMIESGRVGSVVVTLWWNCFWCAWPRFWLEIQKRQRKQRKTISSFFKSWFYKKSYWHIWTQTSHKNCDSAFTPFSTFLCEWAQANIAASVSCLIVASGNLIKNLICPISAFYQRTEESVPFIFVLTRPVLGLF